MPNAYSFVVERGFCGGTEPILAKQKGPDYSEPSCRDRKLVVTGTKLFLRNTLESLFDVTATTCPGDLVAGLA
jgi:hypothetical protein